MAYQSAARELTLSNPTITGGTITGATVGGIAPAQQDLVANGAKATATMTLNAFGSWATGNTIVVPGLASFTIQVDGTPGDLDLRTLTEAQAKAAIDAYITTNSTLVSSVTTGDSMVLTAKASGRTLNGTVVTGTIFTADGVMSSGVSVYTGSEEEACIFDQTLTSATQNVSCYCNGADYREITIVISNAECAANSLMVIRPDNADSSKTYFGNHFPSFSESLVSYAQILYLYTGTKSSTRATLRKCGSVWMGDAIGGDVAGDVYSSFIGSLADWSTRIVIYTVANMAVGTRIQVFAKPA